MEWISAAGEKTLRNCLETCSIAAAYDQVFPRPKEDKSSQGITTKEKEDQLEPTPANHEQADATTAVATTKATTDSTEGHTAQPSGPEAKELSIETTPNQRSEPPIEPHRDLYFYLHRPRTTTKKPVLAPLSPLSTLTAVLRERTVLEFPTIYLLREAPEALLAEEESSSYILEEEYLRTVAPEESAGNSAGSELESGDEDETDLPGSGTLEGVDEKKVLEVLKKDLFEQVPETEH